METRVSSATKEVVIGSNLPTVLIGQRINPTGRKKLTTALRAGDLELVRQEAMAQVKEGADIIDVNVGAIGVNEVELLPQAVKAVMEAVDVPLCIDAESPKAMEAALKIYRGKALLNSVKCEERSLQTVLPLVKEYGAAVVALTMDDKGIPKDAEGRVTITGRIIEHAQALGISRENIIVDCLCMTVAADSKAGVTVLESIRRIAAEFGVNQTIGASNISFNMPDREVINIAFLAAAIGAGVTCPIVDAAIVRPTVTAVDLILGRDDFAQRFIKAYRQRQTR